MTGLMIPGRVAAAEMARSRQAPASQIGQALAKGADDYIDRAEAFEQLAQLPNPLGFEPVGYRLLVMALMRPERYGQIITATAEVREAMALASPQGVVLAVGLECYNRDKFPEGPWCVPGDRVLFQKYAGRGVKLHTGQHLFFLNDDEIVGKADGGYLTQPLLQENGHG